MPSRVLPFEKLNNVRDLGGMKTRDGREIRDGKLIRSGHLSGLDEVDLGLLSEMVSDIVDFRSQKEIKRQPDTEIPGAEYHHIPIVADLTAGITREEEADKTAVALLLHKPAEAREYMCHMYTNFVNSEYGVSQYGVFLRLLRQPHRKAVLWHCTAGKDRAGIGAVLIEEILGVSRQEIIEDYLLTNVHLEEDIRLLSAMVKKKERTDSPLADESLKYLFGADEEYILSFYREAEKKYGSMEDFLRDRLGVTEEDRAAMQEMYLA